MSKATDLYLKYCGEEFTPFKRREDIIDHMAAKESKGLDCYSCEGFCCTYSHNSMEVDPIQALEIVIYLEQKNRLNKDLITKLRDNINHYRLDKDFGFSRGRTLRRYYTCPFFKDESLGCSLSRKIKPYGCLAFNANKPEVSTEGECSSEMSLLEERDTAFKEFESVCNTQITNTLEIEWVSLPIPTGLLDIISKIYPALTQVK